MSVAVELKVTCSQCGQDVALQPDETSSSFGELADRLETAMRDHVCASAKEVADGS